MWTEFNGDNWVGIGKRHKHLRVTWYVFYLYLKNLVVIKSVCLLENMMPNNCLDTYKYLDFFAVQNRLQTYLSID